MSLLKTKPIRRNTTLVLSHVSRLLLAIIITGCDVTVHADDIARWAFDTLPPGTFATGVSPGTLPADVGTGSLIGFHVAPVTTWTGATGNGSLRSLSSNNWTLNDYLQFSFSTVGYSNLNLSWDQLQIGSSESSLIVLSYSTDGTNYVPATPYPILTGAWNIGVMNPLFSNSFNLSSVAAVQDQPNVSIRLSYLGLSGLLSPPAQLRFDNIAVTGTPQLAPGIRNWVNASGGVFATAANWSPAQVPGTSDDAHFEIGNAAYTPTCSSNATSKSLLVNGDQVTLNLNGYTYTTTTTDTSASSVVVQNHTAGFDAKLRVTAGNLVARGVLVDGSNGSQSILEVVGAGAELRRSGTTSDLQLGSMGTGKLLVDDHGYVTTDRLLIGEAGNAVNDTSGAVIISNQGHVIASGAARFGANGGDSDLQVISGGWLETGGVAGADSIIGLGSWRTNKARVSGAGSRWNSTGTIIVGELGRGELLIENGGTVISTNVNLGRAAGSGTITVTGTGSTWTVGDTLDLASDITLGVGSATAKVELGGRINVGKKVAVGPGGSLQVFVAAGMVAIGAVSDATPPIGSIYIGAGGELTGDGEVSATGAVRVQSGGVIAPGLIAPKKWYLNSSYIQDAGSTLKIDVGGSNSYDQLNVLGGGIIAGNLEVTLQPGFTPSHSDQFAIVQANHQITGGFANLDANNRIMTTGGEGSFRVGSAYSFVYLYDFSLTGDFNHNGVYDAADYVVWRKGLGATFTQNDYQVWRSHFGNSSGSGASIALGLESVPEPSAFNLLLVGLLAGVLLLTRARHQSHSSAIIADMSLASLKFDQPKACALVRCIRKTRFSRNYETQLTANSV